MSYSAPESFKASFTCPNCAVFSRQKWSWVSWKLDNMFNWQKEDHAIRVAFCDCCQESSLWLYDKMLYPETGNSPFPNPEMPENVKKLYLEAASIVSKSPRGAAALLRLAVQLLCKDLGENGQNINNDIKELVKKGLPEIVQQSLDSVRVTGNDAVHPGQIDTDDITVVNQLFELINVIIEYMIALPKKVSGIYNALPAEKIASIDIRDKNI